MKETLKAWILIALITLPIAWLTFKNITTQDKGYFFDQTSKTLWVTK